MKILLDTNIVLDLILEREPFVNEAILLFEKIEQGQIIGYIAATTITNIFYIIRKAEGRDTAIGAIKRILIGLQFCDVDRTVVSTALELGLKDFEDGIQLACAQLNHLDAIITRDLKNYAATNFPIWSVKDTMRHL